MAKVKRSKRRNIPYAVDRNGCVHVMRDSSTKERRRVAMHLDHYDSVS